MNKLNPFREQIPQERKTTLKAEDKALQQKSQRSLSRGSNKQRVSSFTIKLNLYVQVMVSLQSIYQCEKKCKELEKGLKHKSQLNRNAIFINPPKSEDAPFTIPKHSERSRIDRKITVSHSKGDLKQILQHSAQRKQASKVKDMQQSLSDKDQAIAKLKIGLQNHNKKFRELEQVNRKIQDDFHKSKSYCSKLENQLEKNKIHSHQMRELKSRIEMLGEENKSLYERLRLQEERHQKEMSSIERKLDLQRLEYEERLQHCSRQKQK